MSNKYYLNKKSNISNIDERLESLKKINKVDAPPFLFSRIKADINSAYDMRTEAPVQWKWSFALTAIAIIILNFSIMFKTNSTETNNDAIEEVVNTMHLSNNNDLYNSYENE